MHDQIGQDFFARDTLKVARELLGLRMVYEGCEGIIVETEAYRDDAASHAVTRPIKGALLRETYGHIYIFFIYGMYHCLNLTTESDGVGAVLIRAVEPTAGLELMQRRRHTEKLVDLTNGPAKLFQAFGFDPAMHGEKIGKSLKLTFPTEPRRMEIASSSRIGISRAKDLPWRFFIKGNRFVSK